MNDRLLEILTHRKDFTITGADKKMLDFFVEYLDHGSLFMVGFDPGEARDGSFPDPLFSFTNDAQVYRFRMSDIRQMVTDMKSGIALDWEIIPFEAVGTDSP